ncbi:MAG: MBL fold metallo-hydrolase [Candidatus Xenobiia bacterium LiM19]
MKVKFYGTRGSIAVSDPQKIVYGGNTTSLRIDSECLPPGTQLVIDTGSGFVPLAFDALKMGVKAMLILYTHYHFDHTIGFTMAPVTFIKSIKLTVYGPEEHSVDPSKMMEDLLKPPYFPVDFREVSSHIKCQGIDIPNSRVFVVHRVGGVRYFTIDQLEGLENDEKMVSFDKGQKYNLNECLIVKMYKSNHPERTISYRLEERSTGKVFVLLTDHENQDGLPLRLKTHVTGADLLVMDAQYDRVRYDTSTAGYGHGTPDYCVKVAVQAGSKMLGFTHHDPNATDEKVDAILKEGQDALTKLYPDSKLQLFACRDYQEIEV